jgi:putative Holliday junction resolvase
LRPKALEAACARGHALNLNLKLPKENMLWLPYLCAVARILAIDYGLKRTGLAVTDPLQIIANALDTVPTVGLMVYLERYLGEEEVERFVVGEPLYPDGNPAQIAGDVKRFVQQLNQRFPNIPVSMQDERFTSEDAKAAIRQSGVRKKERRDKALVDRVAATIILQQYLEEHKYRFL